MAHRDAQEKPSRTARKRAAEEVTDLARQLVDLPASDAARAPLGDELRRELEQARAARSHGARDRQVRHLGGLLRKREEEQEALREFLEDLSQGRRREQAEFHRLEDLRDRLCDPCQLDGALEEAAERFPSLDRPEVLRLARAAQTGDRRAFRELFRLLRRSAGS